jgi:hypothetical protein
MYSCSCACVRVIKLKLAINRNRPGSVFSNDIVTGCGRVLVGIFYRLRPDRVEASLQVRIITYVLPTIMHVIFIILADSVKHDHSNRGTCVVYF